MKRRLLAILLSGLPASRGMTQEANTDRPAVPPPTASELLERVRSTFPDALWIVRGELLLRDARGETVRTLGLELRLDLRAHPPSADARLTDAFGAPLAAVIASIGPDGTVTLHELAADGRAARSLPSDAEALDTGLRWSDFFFDFLWWTRGRVLGLELKRARECWVADLSAPAGARYASVRIWVDVREHLLLQAEGRDASGHVVRRLSVKSVAKVNDRWVVEDIDLETPPRPERVTLRVRETHAVPREVSP